MLNKFKEVLRIFYHSNGLRLLRIVRESFRRTLSEGEHWMRVVMNREIDEFVNHLEPSKLDALEISGTEYSKYSWKSYLNYSYPDFDLTDPKSEVREFDVVICEQVLEHVSQPFIAAQTLYKLVKPGGTLIVNTPFLIKLHGMPDDYWRFTPSGMRVLLENAGFTNIAVHSWGNKKCVKSNLGWWQSFRFYHSLKNQESVPVMIWAFAVRDKA
jgi:SAM-dependent methyltransferase